MEAEGCLTGLLTEGPAQAGRACDGDSVPLRGGAKQRALLPAGAWETVGTGVNGV